MQNTSAPLTHWHKYLWAAWLGFWALMIGVAIIDNSWRGDEPLWRPLLWEGSSMLVSTLVIATQLHFLPALRPYIRLPWQWFGRQLVWLPLIVVLFIGGAYGIRHAVYALIGEIYTHETWPVVLVYESLKIAIFFGLWSATVFGIENFLALFDAQKKQFQAEQSLIEARRALLQAKIHPHFLFNALNTISALMHKNVDEAEQRIADLALLLRQGISLDKNLLVTLAEELTFLRAYSDLMLARFAPRVSIAWQLDTKADDIAVPPLLLQPLLENMFTHGAEKTSTPVHIDVITERDNDVLSIHIESKNLRLPQAIAAGEGLTQVRERLQLAYGDAASFTLKTDEERGVVSSVVIHDITSMA